MKADSVIAIKMVHLINQVSFITEAVVMSDFIKESQIHLWFNFKLMYLVKMNFQIQVNSPLNLLFFGTYFASMFIFNFLPQMNSHQIKMMMMKKKTLISFSSYEMKTFCSLFYQFLPFLACLLL